MLNPITTTDAFASVASAADEAADELLAEWRWERAVSDDAALHALMASVDLEPDTVLA